MIAWKPDAFGGYEAYVGPFWLRVELLDIDSKPAAVHWEVHWFGNGNFTFGNATNVSEAKTGAANAAYDMCLRTMEELSGVRYEQT
jgi:hypothetical protein